VDDNREVGGKGNCPKKKKKSLWGGRGKKCKEGNKTRSGADFLTEVIKSRKKKNQVCSTSQMKRTGKATECQDKVW